MQIFALNCLLQIEQVNSQNDEELGGRLARLGATKASKSLSCKPLSARVRLQPGSICLDMFVNGLAVTWPVSVVSQGIVPVFRTGTCTAFPPPQQPSLLLHLGKMGFG